jgi:hypothetical protein
MKIFYAFIPILDSVDGVSLFPICILLLQQIAKMLLNDSPYIPLRIE